MATVLQDLSQVATAVLAGETFPGQEKTAVFLVFVHDLSPRRERKGSKKTRRMEVSWKEKSLSERIEVPKIIL